MHLRTVDTQEKASVWGRCVWTLSQVIWSVSFPTTVLLLSIAHASLTLKHCFL